MAGLLQTYYSRAGNPFTVNAQGFRVDQQGNLWQSKAEDFAPGSAEYEALKGQPNTAGTERIDPNTGAVYFGGVEAAHVNDQGVVSAGIKAPPAQAWTPTTAEVKPQMTVAEQMQQLLSSNSPYLKEARAGAARTANSRGLLNSSIAAGAGEQAAIQSALPIAQQDANTYFQQGQTNQAAENSAGQFNAGESNKFSLTDFTNKQQLASDLQKMGTAQGYNLDTIKQQLTGDLQKMGVAQSYNLDTMTAQQVNDLAKMTEAYRQDLGKLNVAGAQDIAKLNLQGDIQERLSRLDAELKNTMAQGDDARLRQLEAAKHAAALSAQFIQASGQINSSDIPVKDKQAQIEQLRVDTNNAIRDAYRMFMPDATDAEVNAAVQDANGQLDSLQAINARLDDITQQLGELKPATPPSGLFSGGG